MISKREFVCRFGIGSLDGVHSSVWRVWSGRNHPDLYIAPRGTAGKFKVSLHGSGERERHYGLTSQWATESKRRGYHNLESRHLEQWHGGVSLNPNLSLEYRLFFPTADLRSFDMPDSETADVVWLPQAEDGQAVEVGVLIGSSKPSESWWPGRKSIGTLLLSEGRLSDRRWVWLVHRNVPMGSWQNNETVSKMRKSLEARGVTATTVTPQWRYHLWCTWGDDGRVCVEVAPETIFSA